MHPKLTQWLSEGTYFTFNGLRTFYRVRGSGPTMMVFHGYPYSGFDFEKIVAELERRFTVVIPDMPGMGFSDKPENHVYSFSEMADLYSGLIAFLAIKKIHILSHDLGNSVVQELLARHQHQANDFTMESIAFLNGGLFSDVYKPRLIQVLLSKSPKPIGKLLSKAMTKTMVSKATAEVFGKDTKPTAQQLDIFWEILNYNTGKSIAYLLGRLIFEKDRHQQRWITAMQQTTVPLCFINGPADPNSGIHMANRYKSLIPNPRVYLLGPEIGHWPQMEAPEEVLGALFDFHRHEVA